MLPENTPFRIVGGALIARDSSRREFRVVLRSAVHTFRITTPEKQSHYYGLNVTYVSNPVLSTQDTLGFYVPEQQLYRFLRWIEPHFPPREVLMIEDDSAFDSAYRAFLNQRDETV